MIITPKELQNWIDNDRSFTAVDIREDAQIKDCPILGVDHVVAKVKSIPETNNKLVLMCQFGIVTEGIIIENRLLDTFSLLGGIEAWNAFYSDKRDMSRWSRQTILQEVGLEGQKKLMDSNVIIVGMGGLGCPVAQSLIACGIRKLRIIDGDAVELSNLHRQPLYGIEDIGKMKVHTAKKRLQNLSKKALIEPVHSYLDEKNGSDLIKGATVVIDATDNISTRKLIDKLCKRSNTPMIYGALYRYEGQVAILNVNGSVGYSELFPVDSSVADNCSEAGILGMLPGIIGNIQALETVKLILDIKPNLVGKLLLYDGMNHTTQTIKL